MTHRYAVRAAWIISLVIFSGLVVMYGVRREQLKQPLIAATAALSRSCSPNDAGALRLTVYTENPPLPFITVGLWNTRTLPQRFSYSPDGEGGVISYCTVNDACALVQSGLVTFDRTGSPEQGVSGIVDVVLQTGEHIRRSFQAVWDASRMELCG